jgi:ABC-type transporter Mla subunit MlaD
MVAGSSAGYSTHGGIVPTGSIDPRVDTSAAMRRVDGAETYVYGRLDESDPLGLAHRLVAEAVGQLVSELGDLLDGMTAAAGTTAARYAEADGAIESAARGVSSAVRGES